MAVGRGFPYANLVLTDSQAIVRMAFYWDGGVGVGWELIFLRSSNICCIESICLWRSSPGCACGVESDEAGANTEGA